MDEKKKKDAVQINPPIVGKLPFRYRLAPFQIWYYSYPIPKEHIESGGDVHPRPALILTRDYTLKEVENNPRKYKNTKPLYAYFSSRRYLRLKAALDYMARHHIPNKYGRIYKDGERCPYYDDDGSEQFFYINGTDGEICIPTELKSAFKLTRPSVMRFGSSIKGRQDFGGPTCSNIVECPSSRDEKRVNVSWFDKNISKEAIDFLHEPHQREVIEGIYGVKIPTYAEVEAMREKDVEFFKAKGYMPIEESIESSSKNMNEDIEKHDTLNPALFDGDELRPDVKRAIERIVDKFIDDLKWDGVKFKLKDIVLIGSNVSYNYTKDSDLDIHVIADSSSLDCSNEIYTLLYSAYRSIFNSNYDITIKGIPIELYVELDETKANSNGVYSLHDGWVKFPERREIPDIDMDEFDSEFEEWENRYFDLIDRLEKEYREEDSSSEDSSDFNLTLTEDNC